MTDARSQSIDIEPAAAIKGWMLRRELTWLARQAGLAERILEVGCFHGRSTRVLADHTAGQVFAVDPWNGEYFNDDDTPARWIDTNVYDAFCQNLHPHIESGRIVAIQGAACDALPALADTYGRVFDFIFLDGDHRHTEVLRDIQLALPLLKPGGLLAGHDFDHPKWPGVRRAVLESFPDRVLERVESIWALRP